jgi:hypothetical protein
VEGAQERKIMNEVNAAIGGLFAVIMFATFAGVLKLLMMGAKKLAEKDGGNEE